MPAARLHLETLAVESFQTSPEAPRSAPGVNEPVDDLRARCTAPLSNCSMYTDPSNPC
jgi:hypothetical protein